MKFNFDKILPQYDINTPQHRAASVKSVTG